MIYWACSALYADINYTKHIFTLLLCMGIPALKANVIQPLKKPHVPSLSLALQQFPSIILPPHVGCIYKMFYIDKLIHKVNEVF